MQTPRDAAAAAPIFVLSTARSGSTLLRLTLGKVPGLVSLPESHFFVFRESHAALDPARPADRERIAAAWTAFHRIRKWPLDHARLHADLVAGADSWRRVLELTIARLLADGGVEPAPGGAWIEKSPPHVFRRDAIRELFPEARFLHLVRDPRDVAASLKTCPWATSNVYVAARVWREAARRIDARDDTLLVRYEALVAEPAAEVARICAFLGRPFDPAWIAAPTRDAVEERNVRSGAALAPISERFVGAWRERLSAPDREAAVVQHVCDREMRALGYEPSPVRRDLRFRAHLALGWLGLVADRVVR